MNKIAVKVSESTLELMVRYATISVPVIAIVAAGIAIWQIRSNADVVRRANAYAAYQAYLKTAMDNPLLAFGNELEIRRNAELFDRYKWFVATMLLSFEEILVTCRNEPDWRATIKSQLFRHAWHLNTSSSVKKGHWKPELRSLINEAVANGHKPAFERQSVVTKKYLLLRVAE